MDEVKVLSNPGVERGGIRHGETACIEENGMDAWIRGRLFELGEGDIASNNAYIRGIN